MGEIQLKNWAMRPSVGGGVRVDGLRVDDASGIYWHSSSIVKRINNRLLETNSGSRYRLLGDLDEIYAKDVSDSLCGLSSQFRRGFPRKWKYLIESTARAPEVKSEGDKQRKVTETFQALHNKTPLRKNTKDGKQSFEMLKSVSFVGCHTNRKVVLCNKRISKETPVSQLHSVTRSRTKKLERVKTRNTSYGDGRRLEDNSFDGTILALTRGNFTLGRNLRKRKERSGYETAAKKRKVEGRSVGRNLRLDCFPTPELQNNDVVVVDGFSSQRTSVRNRRQMISTVIEPDILTLEGLLSPPEDASEKIASSQRIIVNPVVVPLDLDELEEDVLQKSFLDADFSERRSKRRSRTVQPKQRKAATKQRKSSSLAPSKSQNVKSATKCPVQTLRSVCGEHNLRPRNVKIDVIPATKVEPRRKKQRLESKSRCDMKKHQPNENVNNCINNQQSENDAVSRSRANHKTVTAKSGLAKGSTKQRLENCDQEQSCGNSTGKVRLTSKKDSQNRARPTSVPRVKCVEVELRSLSAKQISGCRNKKTVKPAMQTKILASAGSEPSIAEKSVVTEPMNAIQLGDGEEGQRMMEDCQDQAGHGVLGSLKTMEVKQIPTAKMPRPKRLKEKEACNDAKTSALKEKKRNKDVNDSKITSVAQEVGAGDHYGKTSVGNPQSRVGNPQSAQIIKLPEHHRVTSLDSKPVEESESRICATVSALTEKGENVESGESSNVTRRNDTDLKLRDRQVEETPHGCRKMQRNSGRFVSQNELKMKNKSRQTTPNVVTIDTNYGNLKRISVPMKTSTPKAKKTVAKKKRTGGKKKTEGAVVTQTNEIENGQSSLSTQRLREQLEEKISKTNVISLLRADSVEVEGVAVEECCLARCAEETVAVNTNVIPPKQKKKRKVAELTGSVINVMNQLQKSQPKTDKEQKLQTKASETNDSIILAKKKDQITNVKLLGGRGTLKRQKELRKLVEANIHCEANNDFFSSTPFQSPRARRFVFPKFEDDDDDIFAGVDLGGALNYDMTDVTPHGFFRVMDYTANKTPASTTSTSTTPAGFKRRRSEQEAYNHRVKKILHLGQRKGRTSRNVPKKPKSKYEPATGAAWKPTLSLDKDLFEVKEVREKDSEEEDFYFVDD